MVEYERIEELDPQALRAQRILTEELWLTLQRQGLKNRAHKRIECFFVASTDIVAAALVNRFPKARWAHEIAALDDPPGAVAVRLISPRVCLTREALLELLDVMMIAAHESGCVFDGFQVDTSDLSRRPW